MGSWLGGSVENRFIAHVEQIIWVHYTFDDLDIGRVEERGKKSIAVTLTQSNSR